MPDHLLFQIVPALQVCLNGNRTRREHAALPLTPAELASAAVSALRAGAQSVHLHPRNAAGLPSLLAADIGAALSAVRAACPAVPLGISTNRQIEPDIDVRLAAVASWTIKPEFASVNFWEAGALELARALFSAGIGVEAGLSGPEDAAMLLESGLAPRCTRILIELEAKPQSVDVLALADQTLKILEQQAIHVPRLLHGEDTSAWPLLRVAFARRLQARIGLEDVLTLPDGLPAADNAALVWAARLG